MSASSVYIHLPFCKTKCPYCDFASFADKNHNHYDKYFSALENEIDYRCQNFPEKQKLETIFFGGGTPSIHSAEELNRVFKALEKYFIFDNKSTEITLEANPGTVDKEKLLSFKNLGINRLSLGVQTFSEELIPYLARGHSVQEAKEIIEVVKDCSFNSWSIDLIYGLPQQNMQEWQETITEALSYDPPHISSYALSIEANTPFGSIYENSNHPDLPQEKQVVEMYEYLNSQLEDNNLERYEISNWSKAGHQAKHNLCYWKADEYYAFGLSAHGYVDMQRYANTRNLQDYQERFSKSMQMKARNKNFQIQENEITELIDEDKALEEKIFLQLRLKSGLKLDEKVKTKINDEKLDSFMKEGYLRCSDNNLSLTDKALFLSNRVIFELIK